MAFEAKIHKVVGKVCLTMCQVIPQQVLDRANNQHETLMDYEKDIRQQLLRAIQEWPAEKLISITHITEASLLPD